LGQCIDKGLALVEEEQETIQRQVNEIQEVAATLDCTHGDRAQRQAEFQALIDRYEDAEDPVHMHMFKLMIGFQPGLFVGEDEAYQDNLDLERWFRLPKSHERRIHGHCHAGVRIVQEGPTLVHALDAHVTHPGPFTGADLLPYCMAREPDCQREAIHRRKIMRKARSKKKRGILLADLERRYRQLS
jgi:hypothetical protein